MKHIVQASICCFLVVACSSQVLPPISCADVKSDLNRLVWSDLDRANIAHWVTKVYGARVKTSFDNRDFSWSSEQLHYIMYVPDDRPVRLIVLPEKDIKLPKVKDLIACLGEPEFYQSGEEFSPAGAQRVIYLWYPRIGVAFVISLDLDRRLRTSHRAVEIYAVNPSSELSEMLYWVHWPNRERLYALDTLRTWQSIDRALWEQ